MQTRPGMAALVLAGWLGLGAWCVSKLLEPAYLLDFVRLFSLC